jgi:hypothetical protein
MATSRRALRGVGYEPEARAGLNPEPGTAQFRSIFDGFAILPNQIPGLHYLNNNQDAHLVFGGPRIAAFLNYRNYFIDDFPEFNKILLPNRYLNKLIPAPRV